MARRGFFAELQHQSRVAAREQERAERAAVRHHMAAMRLAEQTRKADQRMQAELARATAAEQKRLKKEAREAHIEAQEAEVDEQNAKLESDYAEIDSILDATLGVDDHVDLNQLRVVVNHPPFARVELETPIPLPLEMPFPEQPFFTQPNPPTGLRALFSNKKKHKMAVAQAHETHAIAVENHQKKLEEIGLRRREALDAHARAEAVRVAKLDAARAEYAKECENRTNDAAVKTNA